MRSLLLLLIITTTALAQDSLIVKGIDAATSKNYDRINKTNWHLTRDLVIADSGPSGTSVSYHYDKDELIRVVASGYNKSGQWGKEFYPVGGDLAFVYLSQEYFPDKVPQDAPMNWKNIPTHEFRIYLRKGKIIKSDPEGWTGMPAALQKEFDALLKWEK